MKTTSQTLIDQLKFSKREIERRKQYLDFTEADVVILASLKELISENISEIVEEFYQHILLFDEMDRIIGDSETLHRLKNYQSHYILTLFDGQYDEDYVHSRLRIGLVHKRIGVEPKFYVSAIHYLNVVIDNIVRSHFANDPDGCTQALGSIRKILQFDLVLTVDTYINSLLEAAKRSKDELEHYTQSLEVVISERTKSLREQARHDGLTGLLNQQAFYAELKRELLRGLRRNYSTILIYFDLDGFKKLNDTRGHKKGDDILVTVGQCMKRILRESEVVARYGGDEFCIILPDSSVDEAEQVCQRLCNEFEQTTKGTGISCSMGIAISTPQHNQDANNLVKLADGAMYEAKKTCGFSVEVAD